MKKNSAQKLLLVLMIIGALFSSGIIVSAQTKPKMKSKRKPAARLVPVNTNLRIRLEDTLSSKESRVGDKFTATVVDPTRFDEATVTGHISSIKKSGKVKGSTSMNLAFDSIQLPDGRRGTLHGYVTRVYGDNAGKADDEGGVESSGRGKQTLKRAGIAGAGGAIIGAIAGGGKGAGIGLLIGGAAGAGSVALKGSKELKLESGTELLVRVTQ
ncbi:MAG TPA: hypothetical protein VES69_11200 [Pyrinomonadaceae bacterium]|nr:hypothetical protein [Pyrinomonadaceae bacterium]